MTSKISLSSLRPKQLFLIDSIGALLSAILLGVVLVRFESIFGMPRTVLYVLAALALLFFVYSAACRIANLKNWKPFLKGIAIANLMYCCLTIGLVLYYYQELTFLGHLYFVLEVFIVITLAAIEMKTATDPKRSFN